MLLLALLVVVLSSCDTSQPSYTKQSFMNAKERSNTETLFQRNAEAFGLRKLHSQTILRRSKPSFQPSIPNIHLTSQHKPETGAVHCSPLRLGLSPLAERLLRLSIITEGSNAPHKMLPNCGCACNKSPNRHKSSPDRQTWHMVKTIRNSFKASKL